MDYKILTNIDLIDKIVLLADCRFLVAEDNIDCLLLKVALDAHREVVAKFLIKAFARLSLLLQNSLEYRAQSIQSNIIRFPPHELVNGSMIGFREFSWDCENKTIIIQFIKQQTQLMLLIFKFFPFLKKLLSLGVYCVAICVDVCPWLSNFFLAFFDLTDNVGHFGFLEGFLAQVKWALLTNLILLIGKPLFNLLKFKFFIAVWKLTNFGKWFQAFVAHNKILKFLKQLLSILQNLIAPLNKFVAIKVLGQLPSYLLLFLVFVLAD